MWYKWQKLTGLSLFALSICLVIVIGLPPDNARSFIAKSSIPTEILGDNTDTTEDPILIPAWHQIGLRDLPPIQSSGEALGRTWRKGQTPDWFLTLGDLANALEVQVLSLESIETHLEEDLSETRLSSFPLAAQQTLGWLADTVPGMRTQVIHTSALLQELVQHKANTLEPEITLGQLLQTHPLLRKVQLNEINLAPYQVGDIPNLMGIPLEKFEGWKQVLVKDVPGLANLPLGKYPIPVEPRGDLAMKIVEVDKNPTTLIKNTLSGSSTYGFNVPCSEGNCQSIKLSKLPAEDEDETGNFYYWVGGGSQQLEGGYGCLKGGQEPTGRHPFGEAFKVVLTRLEEGQVDTALYFRWVNDCGATPYQIGPVPLLTYSQDSTIFIGREPRYQERDLAEITPDIERASPSQTCELSPSETSELSLAFNGIEVRTATKAIASFFELSGFDYDSIGAYGCDANRNCGRRLGKYGHHSSNLPAEVVSPQWLAKVNAGHSVDTSALLDHFPPLEQDARLFEQVGSILKQLSQKTELSTGHPFEQKRLLFQLVYSYLGGIGADAQNSSYLTAINTSDSLEDAAIKVSQIYFEEAVDKNKCND
ncbi:MULTISPECIES: hypothetical protein [unclassified Coleofasciculus]|uniref:hypothetical protein n=1 Tax=unclassified Coleofasciculus TaxID=2692782 RepID=UPI00187E9CDB|nr:MULTISPECIES: hypothetical protein [unclassified Coleofasciculus]MBE9124753.1 hypothetical protein [Coleofasciculus sp. LEGE 07081]MBE9148205.1 hypothetical protein [Coleofasciculus sp. LEGE 07092]